MRTNKVFALPESRQRLAALAARRWRGSCGENVLLGGAAGQLPPAGRFRGKLTGKASPFPSDVANGHPVRSGLSTIVSTLLGSLYRSSMI